MTQQDQLNAIAAWQTATANANQLRAAYDATNAALATEQQNFTTVQAQAAATIAAEQKKVTAATANVTAAKAVLDTANLAVGTAYNWMIQCLQCPLDPPSTGAELV